jgi:hypothetical protein
MYNAWIIIVMEESDDKGDRIVDFTHPEGPSPPFQ